MSVQLETEGIAKVERQLVRYIVAAGSGAALDAGIFIFLREHAGFHYIGANAISWFIGVVIGYYLCVKWVFPFRRVKSHFVEFLLFCLIGVGGLCFTYLALWVTIDFMGFSSVVSKVIATGFQFAFNFTIRKLALFSRIKTVADSPPLEK